MQFTNGLAAAAIVGFTIIGAHVAAQGTPQAPPPAAAPQTPPPAGAPPAPGGRGQGRGGGRGATFPAQQRPPGDPQLIERGKGIYTINCTACHGQDLRGGVTGGPNLLRSAVVLNDQSGELIQPIIRGARADKGMPPLPLSDDDIKAVAEYIHSVLSTARGQGAPPESETPPPNALVGDAAAGQVYFAAKCSSCHSPTGDLQGIGSRLPEAKMLQNHWITGGGGGRSGGRGRGGRAGGSSAPKPITVTVTLPSGEKVEGPLVRIDDFLVTVRLADGTLRTVRRTGNVPKVEINDPLHAHRALLAEYTDKDMHDVTAFLATLK
jgi:cytochrome c oxidase cbb3-type subunit III